MSSNTFESLRVWHDARRLTAHIYLITRDGTFGHDYGLRDQIRRAAVSVMSNIAEGHERGGTKEFLRFLSIAKGSCGEVRSQLYAAEDVGYIEAPLAAELRGRAAELSRKIQALAQSRRKKAAKGG
jgi:four helix bundle protein